VASALNSAANRRKRKFKGFKPPTAPPPSTYDPVLDQQLRAAQRGYGDLQQDTERDQTRATNDYSIAQNRTNEQSGYSLADILRNTGRESQDYQTATGNLNRQYTQLASSQGQAANAAGLLGGGFAQQAAQKRAANQQIDQTQLDTTHQRAMDDYATQAQRTGTATQENLGDLGLNYQRGNEDRNTTQSRSGRELGFYSNDVAQSRFYQARANGYIPPTRPAGEHSQNGVVYRDLGNGHFLLPSGQIVNKNSLARRLRQARK
jgi:hypothetical protein